MQTIVIIVLFILVVGSILGVIINEPLVIISAFNIVPNKFRLYRPKHSSVYHLQVKVLFTYYFICRNKDEYTLQLNSDRWCMSYPNHLILSNRPDAVFSDKYDIIKYYSDTSSPEDTIKL